MHPKYLYGLPNLLFFIAALNRYTRPVTMNSFDLIRRVLDRFPLPASALEITGLGNAGGFSGARLWRLEIAGKSLCLKAGPKGVDCQKRLSQAHEWMRSAHRRGLHFVPNVFLTHEKQSWTIQAGRTWELTDWMPGKADFCDDPSESRLKAACQALAILHTAWECRAIARPQACPAVIRRLHCAGTWSNRLSNGWRPEVAGCSDPLKAPVMRAFELLSYCLHDVIAQLKPWSGRRFVCQPCLCDVWHDHVLFRGAEVSGIIDYGSMKIDNAAVDLARLLGSLVGDRSEFRRAALEFYKAIRGMSKDEEELVDVLDKTGTVLALGNWLDRLLVANCHPTCWNEDRIAKRIAQLCRRVELWGTSSRGRHQRLEN